MCDAKPLQGQGIVVTRPAAQAEGLCQAIEVAGGRAIRFPTLAIQRLETAADRRRLAAAKAYDGLIYISANAVRCGAPPTISPPPLFAVGQATQRALEAKGFQVRAAPEPPYDSEALLALPQLHHVSGRRFLIVRGAGGREYLAEQLRLRGAWVEHAAVYRRVQPKRDPADLIAAWARGDLHAFTVASGETLENLTRILGPECPALLRETPIVVPSRRVLQKARALGLTQPITTATDPGAAAMTQAVIQALSHSTASDTLAKT